LNFLSNFNIHITIEDHTFVDIINSGFGYKFYIDVYGVTEIGRSDFYQTYENAREEAILKSVKKTGCLVTAEEHNIIGGLGESVSRTLVQNHLVPQEFVAVNDSFGESGTPDQLMEKYGLNSAAIVEKAEKVIKRK
jgi:hypothetical protein